MKIGNRSVKEEIADKITADVKKKKELNYLADVFVKERLKDYLARNAKVVSFLLKTYNERSAEYKQIIKDLRKELRKVHGLFRLEQNIVKRREYFNELVKLSPKHKSFLDLHKKILETHSSTEERLDFYEKLYGKLFKITGKPKAIIDLGCGINPFSIPLMGLKKLNYYAYDVDTDEMELVKEYFSYLKKSWKGFSGKAGVLDLMQWERIKRHEKADLCLLWKMTDVLDRVSGHKASEMVIANVPAKEVAVSFPTYTMSGKRMNQPRRKWIELMCKRLGFNYKIIKEKNEIFYVIKK